MGRPLFTLYIIISVGWRRCIGIEPIYDSVSAVHSGLKSGAPTSGASISVYDNSDLGVYNFSCFNLCSLWPYNFLETELPASRVSPLLIMHSAQTLRIFVISKLPLSIIQLYPVPNMNYKCLVNHLIQAYFLQIH